MQLVLDDEIGRRQRTAKVRSRGLFIGGPVVALLVDARHVAEQRAHSSGPWQGRELVDRRDQERRQPPIDRLIHRNDGQVAVSSELAMRVVADDRQVLRLVGVGPKSE